MAAHGGAMQRGGIRVCNTVCCAPLNMGWGAGAVGRARERPPAPQRGDTQAAPPAASGRTNAPPTACAGRQGNVWVATWGVAFLPSWLIGCSRMGRATGVLLGSWWCAVGWLAACSTLAGSAACATCVASQGKVLHSWRGAVRHSWRGAVPDCREAHTQTQCRRTICSLLNLERGALHGAGSRARGAEKAGGRMPPLRAA